MNWKYYCHREEMLMGESIIVEYSVGEDYGKDENGKKYPTCFRCIPTGETKKELIQDLKDMLRD